MLVSRRRVALVRFLRRGPREALGQLRAGSARAAVRHTAGKLFASSTRIRGRLVRRLALPAGRCCPVWASCAWQVERTAPRRGRCDALAPRLPARSHPHHHDFGRTLNANTSRTVEAALIKRSEASPAPETACTAESHCHTHAPQPSHTLTHHTIGPSWNGCSDQPLECCPWVGDTLLCGRIATLPS